MRLRALLTALAGLLTATQAGAVITIVSDTGAVYGITLRVGAVTGVDTVAFAVSGNNAGLTPAAVTGTPAIDVWVQPVRPVALLSVGLPRPVTLRVDSSLGMTCNAGACGSTVIPFTKVSWTASNNSAAGTGDILGSGTFDGTTTQAITSPGTGFDANATTCTLIVIVCTSQSRNITATRMTFSYANDTVYPAGVYKGTVRFTASME